MNRLQPSPPQALHAHADAPPLRGGATGHPLAPHRETIGDLPTPQGFSALKDAYAASGGLARGEDLARLLEDKLRGDFIDLARAIAAREVFALKWRGAMWVPMFQFDLRDLSLRPRPQQVVAELGAEFDGWALAAWFAEPNAWLAERRPVDVLYTDLRAVLDAARADRFIAVG